MGGSVLQSSKWVRVYFKVQKIRDHFPMIPNYLNFPGRLKTVHKRKGNQRKISTNKDKPKKRRNKATSPAKSN